MSDIRRTNAGSGASTRAAAGTAGESSRTTSPRKKNQKSSQSHRTSSSAGKGSQRKRRKKKHPRLRLAIKLFFLIFLLAVLAGMILFYVKYGSTLLKWQSEAKDLVKKSSEDTFKVSEASLVYDSKGRAIAQLKGDKESYYLTYDEIPQAVKDAFVVTEDRDFYKHSGYDLKAILSAGLSLIKSKMRGEEASRGASTITQQLARGIYLDYTDKSYSRKIREIFIAMEMEKKYDKDEILEFYINNIYFSSGYYGIEAASRGYFSKSASDLTLGEIAFLCSIPNRPTLYDPFEHFDNTIERKGRILDQMLEHNYITAAEYSDAYYQDIVLNPAEAIKNQDYMTTYVMSCATKALMEQQGFEFRHSFNSDAEEKAYEEQYSEMYDECNKSLYTEGYEIRTSLNRRLQKKLQKAVNQQLAAFTEKNKDGMYELQGAATCINNTNGRVVAIVGGRHQKKFTGYTLNRAYQSFRQPGSSFKPLAVYTPALENGYTPDTIVDDTYFEGGPRNSDGSYSGKIPLRTAVEKSKNVVAWRIFEELTPSVGLSYVRKMNFSKIVSQDNVPAAALGGLTNGVSTVEMASAYATLANDGKFREPTCIVKILDSEGKVLVNNNKKIKEKQIYEETAARTMTNILQGVLIRGTAAGKGLSNMPCAGKTGTTSDKKDGWFCGYTPYYSTAVWVGYDTPRTLSNLYGNTYPLYIWRQFMEELHAGKAYKDFDQPEDGSGTTFSDSDDLSQTEEEAGVTPTPMETIDPDAADDEPENTAEPDRTTKPTEPPEPAAPSDAKPTQPVGGGLDDVEDVGEDTTVEDVGRMTQ